MDQKNFSLNTQRYLQCYHDILNTMINDMNSASIMRSLSMTFINQMIPHHNAAIQMSQNLLLYTTNIELQNIACNIITSQTKSIQNMMNIYPCCTNTNTQEEIHHYLEGYHCITNNMFTRMQNAQFSNNINISFINEMIPHHEGAIAMSKNLLQYSICPELCSILEAIITSQEKGVKEMKILLQKISSTKY